MLLYPLQSTTAEGYHSHISIPLFSSNQVLGGVSDLLASVLREKEEREEQIDKAAMESTDKGESEPD